jgi:hypothetical protein
VKVLEKKRQYDFKRHLDPRNPDASIVNYRLVWYSASLLMYGWFLSWIAYDIFVWHKPITQVSLTNYVGAVTAMSLIWAGTKLFHQPGYVVVEQPRNQRPAQDKEPSKRRHQRLKKTELTQPPKPNRAQPETENPQEQPETLTTPTQTATPVSGCSCHVGYLGQHGKAKEIPEECLTCAKLIECTRSSYERTG